MANEKIIKFICPKCKKEFDRPLAYCKEDSIPCLECDAKISTDQVKRANLEKTVEYL
ncbi:hypothetical protein C8R14_1773 [Nitrosomonas eutropha]|uniref:Uncharacterized protein n=1 Tax=Nitrosomonas eutropha TaxID=916 RepID=A0ABX5M300_9PROT|nr:hypothetical protein C8R14_1773 [Nitrosomonas eutropha]